MVNPETVTRTCVVCGGSMEGRRPQARTCSAACRQRLYLNDGYVPTDEDRAAILVAERAVPIPVPPLTPEQVRAHVLATARRGGE